VKFLTEDGQREIKAAIEAVEGGSSVEVVVAVRQRLARWPSAHVAIGLLAALAMLAFQLYVEDIEFDYWSILLLPILVGVAAGMAVELLPGVQRALTAARVRARLLREGSRAAFYELGVHKTTGRTGLLVFVAIRDRRVALVGDVAVVEAVGQAVLDQHAAVLTAEIPNGLVAIAKKLCDLAPVMAKPLPKQADDIDELANAVHAVGRRRRVPRGVAP
jgi:putative membrane protein